MIATKRTGWLLVLAAIILLALPLMLLLKDVVRDAVVLPIMRTLWSVQIFLWSFDSLLWWLAFLAAALLLFWRSLGRAPKPVRHVQLDEPAPMGRVAFWANEIERAGHSDYARWQLQRDLAHVALEIVWPGQEITMDRLGSEAHPSGLVAPPEVRAFLQAGLQRPSLSSAGSVSRWIQRSLRGGHDTAPSVDLEKTVAFLEEQLQ